MRFLAPLALLAAIVGVIVVVQSSRPDTTESSGPATGTTATQPHRPAKPKRRVYVIKAGDNLTVIAEKTGVSIETLEELNPDVDPHALQAGQRIKLTR